jgi:hypothetical protein
MLPGQTSFLQTTHTSSVEVETAVVVLPQTMALSAEPAAVVAVGQPLLLAGR